MNNQALVYFYGLISLSNKHYNTHNCFKISQIFCRAEAFSNLYLPQEIREWNKLDTSISQARSYSVIRKALLDFIWQTANRFFRTDDVCGLKVLTRLTVGFSHLREHIFKHNFQDTLDPWCPCFIEAEDSYHFCMCCQSVSNQRNVLFDDLNSINPDILKMSENEIVQVLLSSNKSFTKDMNSGIITSPIRFIKDKKRFDESIFFLRVTFLTYFHPNKNLRYFFTFCINVLCKLSASKRSRFSFCLCVVIYSIV